MPELRHLLDKPTSKAMWALKDNLDILSKDPMRLHKTAFVEYLRAKGEQLQDEGADIISVRSRLRILTDQWKQEAKKHATRTA